MFVEHIIYSSALAIIIGMLLKHYDKPDISWIIILMALVPDSDIIIGYLMKWIGLTNPFVINHGDFHNIFTLFYISTFIAILMSFKTKDLLVTWLMCLIGFGAHLIEDLFVYSKSYKILYPLSSDVHGWNIIPETRDFFGIAGTNILLFGIFLLIIAITIRTIIHNSKWIEDYISSFHKLKNDPLKLRLYSIATISAVCLFFKFI